MDLRVPASTVVPAVTTRVLVDESHSQAWSLDPEVAARLNPAQPADASYALAADALRRHGFTVEAHRDGPLLEALAAGDVLVIAHPASPTAERASGAGSPVFTDPEIDAIEAHVRGGGGLVVLGECNEDAYGTNLAALLARFGVGIRSLTVHDAVQRHNNVSAWVLADLGPQPTQGPMAGVAQACFYRAGALTLDEAADGRVLMRTSATADPPQAPLAVAVRAGHGRVVVLADSDLVGDDSIDELDHRRLWVSAVTWAAVSGATATAEPPAAALAADPRWLALKAAVLELREWQVKDGSVDVSLVPGGDLAAARACVERICAGIEALASEVPYDAAYLAATVADFRGWAESGLGVPDFSASLAAFHPDEHRVDGALHLVVAPMYTQNGNPARQVEAVLWQVLWPGWLAEVEAEHTNPAFLSISFVDFTPGYDTHSAVLFPETFAAQPIPRYTWGAIFSDREAARFRAVVTAAAEAVRLDLPPVVERLVADQALCQGVFAMWDLIHDRTHSHGDLPFDPFMIKQRMPYWLYTLEETRCDLNTFTTAVRLAQEGHPLAEAIQHAILLDRVFRFTVTGGRVRNYDGLGGQLIFAHLHRHGAIRWTDNTLTVDWARVPALMVQLTDEVNGLYRAGIDRSKVAHWLATHEFVASYVRAHPKSLWAKGADALPLDGTTKEIVDTVLDDEFPLNVFFEALARRIGPVIEATRGITGASDVSAVARGGALAPA